MTTPSNVYFTNLRTNPNVNLLDKLERLVKKAGIEQINFEKQYVAIKIHFGEPGNLAYIRPNYVARIVDLIAKLGGKPFLTDSNTLYKGGRGDAVTHIRSAMHNGFNPIAVNAPIIIADGLKGTEYNEIEINQQYCRTAKIGTAVANADIIVSMNHFKGHEQAGFGGALKNLGMGAASVGGKLELHSGTQPEINTADCTGCNICVKNCAHDAIKLNEKKKAVISFEKCVGCGQCVALCQYNGAIVADWGNSVDMNCKIAEYTLAIVHDKPHFHISFIMNVSPDCDCWGYNDVAVVPDIGIAASFDPVALDYACADLVMQAPVMKGSVLDEKCACGHNHNETDKFKIIHPNVDWKIGLAHAEEIGVGQQAYNLVQV